MARQTTHIPTSGQFGLELLVALDWSSIGEFLIPEGFPGKKTKVDPSHCICTGSAKRQCMVTVVCSHDFNHLYAETAAKRLPAAGASGHSPQPGRVLPLYQGAFQLLPLGMGTSLQSA